MSNTFEYISVLLDELQDAANRMACADAEGRIVVKRQMDEILRDIRRNIATGGDICKLKNRKWYKVVQSGAEKSSGRKTDAQRLC